MHNRDRYPAIWAEFESAKKSLEPLMAARKTKTDEIAAVQLQIDELMVKKSALNDEAMVDAPQIAELREIIARLAKAMGAKSASGV